MGPGQLAGGLVDRCVGWISLWAMLPFASPWSLLLSPYPPVPRGTAGNCGLEEDQEGTGGPRLLSGREGGGRWGSHWEQQGAWVRKGADHGVSAVICGASRDLCRGSTGAGGQLSVRSLLGVCPSFGLRTLQAMALGDAGAVTAPAHSLCFPAPASPCLLMAFESPEKLGH